MTSVRVLLVEGDGEIVADLERAGIALERVESVDAVAERLADASDAGEPVHCVVGTLESDADSGGSTAGELVDVAVELSDAVRTHDDLLPVVLAGDAPLADVADAVLYADAEDYVSLDGEASSALATAIEDATTTYRRRLDRRRIHTDLPDEGCVVRDGQIDAASDEFGGLFDATDVVGRSLTDLVAAADQETLASVTATTGETTEGVWVTPRSDRHRTVELRLRHSPTDGAIVIRARDVSEEAIEHEALVEAAEQLDSLLQTIPMSIYFKDHLGRHERVSDHITHTDPEDYIRNDEGKVHPHADDVVGKTDFDLYAPSFAEETYEDDMRVIEEEDRVINRIEEGTTSLGEQQYTSTTKVPRYDEAGNVVGLVGVTIDVTERMTHREELERQNERLNEFAEVLTHDLRNPLNIANGYLDALEETYDEEAVQEVSNALGRMESLIEEIRSYVLEGRLVEEPEAVDLRSAAEEAWSTADTGSATLEIEGDMELKADRTRFRRLLENLFRNAIEHGTPDATPDDTPPLTVRIVAGVNEFAVEDDGVGIPENVAADIFERGYSTGDDGTGFGLAIVESIAEAHGWSISVEESDAGGARFVFSDVVRAEAEFGKTIA